MVPERGVATDNNQAVKASEIDFPHLGVSVKTPADRSVAVSCCTVAKQGVG